MHTDQGRPNLDAPPESNVSGHRNDQRIAERIVGNKVVRSDGSRASLARIFWLRNFVNALPGAIPLPGNIYKLIDYLVIFGVKQQCTHDMIADTIVVKA